MTFPYETVYRYIDGYEVTINLYVNENGWIASQPHSDYVTVAGETKDEALSLFTKAWKVGKKLAEETVR